MKKSLSYYLTLFVIKLKGIKKTFNKAPIDYIKLRKEDIHNPPAVFFKKYPDMKTFMVQKTKVTEIVPANNSSRLVLFVHGGAFVYGPVKHHWHAVEQIAKRTGDAVWICDYPKAPEHKISALSKNIDAVYNRALEKFKSENIRCIGDSVGATLLITLVQRLINNGFPLPDKIVLISPVIDASLTNPEIDAIESTDPILSRIGVVSAKLMCSENNNLADPLISPIVGSFERFPKTALFIADNDITFPDQLIFVRKLQEAKVRYILFLSKGMPHIWPLLPVMKEAKSAFNNIIEHLNQP